MNPNGLMLPRAMAEQPSIQVASPMNDLQLVCLIAAQQPTLSPEDAVKRAMEIVAYAVKADRNKTLKTMVEKALS